MGPHRVGMGDTNSGGDTSSGGHCTTQRTSVKLELLNSDAVSRPIEKNARVIQLCFDVIKHIHIYIYIARSLRGNEVATYMEDSILEVSAVRDGTCTVDLWLSAGRLLSLSHLSIRRSCPTVMQHVSLLELKITYSKRFDEANTACCGTLCLAQEIGYSAWTLFSRWNLHLRSHSARLRKGARVQGMKGENSKN